MTCLHLDDSPQVRLDRYRQHMRSRYMHLGNLEDARWLDLVRATDLHERTDGVLCLTDEGRLRLQRLNL